MALAETKAKVKAVAMVVTTSDLAAVNKVDKVA